MKRLKPIRSEKDYGAATTEVEVLWGAKSGTAKSDRLNVLTTLIEAWEAANYPMDPPDPIEAIKFRMEQQGLARKDLEGIIGTRACIAEVLDRKRAFDCDDKKVECEAAYSCGGLDQANKAKSGVITLARAVFA